ncbi:hypothetical protein LC612_38615, partial [Nostoc sp. CHAB 5834]|nr:hypothetical protein [Nostoc sp. CHAB 5834]
MSSELIKRIFSLREQNNPLIAVESPLQERISLLENLTKECINLDINCYLWMLEDDKLYQLIISNWGLAFSEIKEYKRIAFKVVREDSFEILRFWKTSQLQGILILEGIYPWLGQGATDADFFLTAEWIKSALINIKLYNDNSGKTALLLGSNASLKSDIAGLIPIITQELPTVEEISDYLPQILPDLITQAQINEIANTCVGMYLADIETGVKTALAIDNSELVKKSTISLVMLAMNGSYQWGIELTMLVTAFLGPLAVGGSLLPYGAKSIYTWLIGYFSIGIGKLSFNMIVGFAGQ